MFGNGNGNIGIVPPAQEEEQHWDTRIDVLCRQDAIPFLRNGFFQDAALASVGERLVVASQGHFRQPLLSDQQVAAIQFCPPVPKAPKPTGKDGELFEYALKTFSGWDYETKTPSTIAAIRQHVETLVHSGASVARSCALQVACRNNAFEAVKLLLEIEPAAINHPDNRGNNTPLMLAAMSAAGRCSRSGIDETKVVDYLLSNGADKGLQDRNGMTAYGRFVQQREEYAVAIQAMAGRPVTIGGASSGTRSERALQAKLTPVEGPSAADLTGGRHPGIVDYGLELSNSSLFA